MTDRDVGIKVAMIVESFMVENGAKKLRVLFKYAKGVASEMTNEQRLMALYGLNVFIINAIQQAQVFGHVNETALRYLYACTTAHTLLTDIQKTSRSFIEFRDGMNEVTRQHGEVPDLLKFMMDHVGLPMPRKKNDDVK